MQQRALRRRQALAVGGRSCVGSEASREDSMSDKSDRRDFSKVDRISPPLISSWVRAQRVLSVEAVVDVERAILWPDSDDSQPVRNNNR